MITDLEERKIRYNRNIIIDLIGEEGQNRLAAAKVLVAGAGGLGSTVLANLSAVGVGNIGIIDNDKLELSNLNRQYIHKYANIGKVKVESAKEWINGFNPDINVEVYPVRLDESNYHDIISGYDLVIDCFDTYKSKFLLNKIAISANKTLIHGGVTEFYGQATVIIPSLTGCLKCLFPTADMDIALVKGVISPAVTTIASIESMETVKLLLGIGKPLINRLITYNGLTMEYREVQIRKNPDCPLCSSR